jgi:ubiquinone/menaquinone biosynthesis C-methylase UbiE
MSWYEQHVMNRIIERVLGTRDIENARRQVLASAEGAVLEVGLGTGLNLLAYPPAVRALTTVTRDAALHPLAVQRAGERGISIQHLQGNADHLPCADKSADTVVSTFLFCSISGAEAVAREYARVLRPEGRLLVLEHVRAENRVQRIAQRIMDLPSRAVLCGCSLVRDSPAILRQAGFRFEALEYVQLPTLPWTHSYLARGVARLS